ncbi:hypothetical protein WN944_021539 [Citrus x changshan-huyou]|uniref:Uncharacterized protein n=1 Tax=Citrus x changshan-huyou TaxID=2935761 RepID=A0AAP0MX02_9ROSI
MHSEGKIKSEHNTLRFRESWNQRSRLHQKEEFSNANGTHTKPLVSPASDEIETPSFTVDSVTHSNHDTWMPFI